MKRESALLLIFLTILVTGLSSLGVHRVEASGTVYIRADGSIDPPTSPISTVDNVTYILTGNITSDADGIVVEKDNIVIDGAGFAIKGTGVYYWHGIDMDGRSKVTIRRAVIRDFECGIWLNSSSNNSMSENNITNNSDGISLYYHSNNNIIARNNITDYDRSIWLHSSSNNSISGNNISSPNYGITLDDSSYNSISGNNITDSGLGVYLWHSFSSNNNVSGNNIVNNGDGILLSSSSHNSVSGNNITENKGDGISLWSSSYNSVSGNNITNNHDYGISLVRFINLISSSSNSICGNTITENSKAGIFCYYSSNNTVYDNNFVNNTQQVFSSNSTNVWDDGYPSGGNYWSDYNGTDANHDGIGDTPYVIDANNTDRYPLMTPYVIPEFSSFLILQLFFVATVLAVAVCKQKIRQKRIA